MMNAVVGFVYFLETQRKYLRNKILTAAETMQSASTKNFIVPSLETHKKNDLIRFLQTKNAFT